MATIDWWHRWLLWNTSTRVSEACSVYFKSHNKIDKHLIASKEKLWKTILTRLFQLSTSHCQQPWVKNIIFICYYWDYLLAIVVGLERQPEVHLTQSRLQCDLPRDQIGDLEEMHSLTVGVLIGDLGRNILEKLKINYIKSTFKLQTYPIKLSLLSIEPG